MKNLYSILGVLRSATKEQIRSKYRERALQVHPDKAGGEEALQAVDMVEVAVDQAEELANRVQGKLLEWLGARLGIRSSGHTRR